MENEIIGLAKGVEKYIIEHRRQLHKIPELHLELPKTLRYITDELYKIGVGYRVYEDISSVVAVIDGREKGKTIAIRCDMDALPIKEETDLPFSSTNGNMHACGHDGHMAVVLGTAKLLEERKNNFKGRVKLIFQAGEEYPGGAKPLIENDVLRDVDAIIGMHAGNLYKDLKKGCIGFKSGALMASMDRFLIRIIGKGGHGASPENAVDSINIACEIVQSLNKIPSREVSSTEPAILSVTRINGGINQNVLPDVVEIEGTCRSTSEQVRQLMYRRIGEVSNAIANVYGAKVEYQYDFKYPAVINDEKFTEFAIEKTKKVIDKDRIKILKKPVMSSDDMAFYLNEIPGTYFFLSNPKWEENPDPHHNSKFDMDEELLYLPVAVYLNIVEEFLKWN